MEQPINVYDYDRRISRMTQRVTQLADIRPRNKKAILDFKSEATAQGYSKARVSKFLEILTILARQMKKDFDKVTREHIMEIVTQIEARDFSDWTKYTYKTILKVFYKWLNGGGEYPEEVRWIKTLNRRVSTKLPEELLTEEEIKAMVERARHPRDKALVSVLADGGLRIGEALSRRIKHVALDEHGAVLVVNGKTGMRRVRLIYAAPHLITWLNLHPFRGVPEAPLWLDLRKNGHQPPRALNYINASGLIKRIALEAGIKKRIHAHLFRHSRATSLASHLTEAQLNHHFGWIQGSRMTATYVHMSGREVDNALLSLAGVKSHQEDEKTNALIPSRCPRCSHFNSEKARVCERCWLPLDTGLALDAQRELENSGQLVQIFLQDPEVQMLFRQKIAGLLENRQPGVVMR